MKEDADEKAQIIELLVTILKKHVLPDIQQLVTNQSAEKRFEHISFALVDSAADLMRLVVFLSHQDYAAQTANPAFIVNTSLKDGFFCQQIGQWRLSYLVPKVPLMGPLADSIQQAAALACGGTTDIIPPVILSIEDQHTCLKTLHPVCRYKTATQPGSTHLQLVLLSDTEKSQLLDDMCHLLETASRLNALGELTRLLAYFAGYAGNKAMFNPDLLQTVLSETHILMQQEIEAFQHNALIKHLKNTLDKTCFTKKKVYKKLLDCSDQKPQPALLRLIGQIEKNIAIIQTNQVAITHHRDNFEDIQHDMQQTQQAIMTGLLRLSKKKQLADIFQKELEAASGIQAESKIAVKVKKEVKADTS